MAWWRAATVLVLLLSLAAPTTALGVAQEYHENRTVPVPQGSSALHRINIQNPTEDPLRVQVTLKSNLTTIDGRRNYTTTLPPESYENDHYINITIPPSLEPGTTRKAAFTVQPLLDREGQVGMSYRIHDDFTIRVTQPQTVLGRVTETLSSGAQNVWALRTHKVALAAVFVFVLGLFLTVLYNQSSIFTGLLTRKKTSASPAERVALKLSKLSADEFASRKESLARWAHEQTGKKAAYHAIANAQTPDDAVRTLLFNQ